LLDILEAIEGETRLNICLASGPSCDRKSWCPAHPVWQEAQQALTDVLHRASLDKLVRAALAGGTPRFDMPCHGKPGVREGRAKSP
jgi:DNA-binding IscR family transcriptional regulator